MFIRYSVFLFRFSVLSILEIQHYRECLIECVLGLYLYNDEDIIYLTPDNESIVWPSLPICTADLLDFIILCGIGKHNTLRFTSKGHSLLHGHSIIYCLSFIERICTEK